MEWRTSVEGQLGAAIDMLEQAIVACPDSLWGEASDPHAFWYVAYHTLFFLDCYVSDEGDDYAPPPPFTRDELDERGLLPPRVYVKTELLDFCAHGRARMRSTLSTITDDESRARCAFTWLDLSRGEMLLYTMRHVQHHTGQLNMLLRQSGHPAPRWVRTAR